MKAVPPPGALAGDTPFLWTMTVEPDGAATISAHADAPHIALARSDGGFVWLHVNAADSRGRRWIESLEIVPADARGLLTGPAMAQRLHAAGDALWGALVDYAQDFGQDIDQDAPSAQDLTQLRFVAAPGYVITTRRRPSRSAAAVRRAAADGKSFSSAFDLVDAIVDQSMQAMDDAIEVLAQDLDDVEDRVLDDETRDERRRLGVLRRSLIRVHREIGGALRMVSRFDPQKQSAPAAQAVVQRLAMRLDACNQEVQATEQRARLLQDEIVSKLTTDTNRQLYTLTILSAVLMPATLISGIFGMNVKGLPFAEEERGFLYAAAACGVAALAVWALLWRLIHRPAPLSAPTRPRKRAPRDMSEPG